MTFPLSASALRRRTFLGAGLAAALPLAAHAQIGRASGRERV